jgi:hypothetical protein
MRSAMRGDKNVSHATDDRINVVTDERQSARRHAPNPSSNVMAVITPAHRSTKWIRRKSNADLARAACL